MGLYRYIDENDRVNLRVVIDPEVKEIFQEALQFDKSLMIDMTIRSEKPGLFRKPKDVIHYDVLHECYDTKGNPAYQARYQVSGSGSKAITMAYLYGIINGALSQGGRPASGHLSLEQFNQTNYEITD